MAALRSATFSLSSINGRELSFPTIPAIALMSVPTLGLRVHIIHGIFQNHACGSIKLIHEGKAFMLSLNITARGRVDVGKVSADYENYV